MVNFLTSKLYNPILSEHQKRFLYYKFPKQEQCVISFFQHSPEVQELLNLQRTYFSLNIGFRETEENRRMISRKRCQNINTFSCCLSSI